MKAIIIGIIISTVSGVIVAYFKLHMEHRWFGEDTSSGQTATSRFSPAPMPEIPCTPPAVSDPKIPLKILEYSTQKDADHPASAVVDGYCGTAWISGAPSSPDRYVILRARNARLIDISSVQLCTALPGGPQAAMAVREVTLLSSLDVEPSRTLQTIGTYSLPPGQACHHLTLSSPITMKVLVIYINKNAGDPSALISEVTVYGLQIQ